MATQGLTPHNFQFVMIDGVRNELAKGHRKVIIQAPTGAGKTVVGSWITKLALEKGRQTLWLCHTRELVDQASGTLWDVGVPNAIIMAGRDWAPSPVQVASKDTLASRVFRRGTMAMPKVDLIITDEARLSLAPRWLSILQHYVDQGVPVLGLDATPARMSGLGLGDWYNGMVCAPPTSKLIEMGMLVPCHVKAPKPSKEAELVGDIFKHWQLWAGDRQTIIFAQSVRHSMYIRDMFAGQGIAIQHLDHKTPDDIRDQAVQDMKSGKIQIITTCSMLVNGWDDKRVSCCVLACIVRSFPGFKQRVGRILRACPGKKDAILIDHAGSIYEHGYMPDDDVDWSLDKNRNIHKELKRKPPDKKATVCPACFSAFRGSNKCPVCGFVVAAQAKVVHHKAGLLFDLDRKDLQKREPDTMQRFWTRSLFQMANMGRTAGAAAQMFQKQFKLFPWNAGVEPLPASNQYGKLVSELYPDFMRSK